MKTCKKCGLVLPLESFPKHPKTKDGHINKCKACKTEYENQRLGNRRKERLLKNLFQIPEEWRVKPKRSTQRSKCSPETRRTINRNHAAKYPEKIAARVAVRKLPKLPGYEHHHWSYKKEHYTDTISLSKEDHKLVTAATKYVKEERLYKRKDTGELLDTKEKHLVFIGELLARHKQPAV